MPLPLKYNFRNVFVRWRATAATVLCIALVVAVYVLVQSLAVGLEKCSQNTGDPRNVIVVRKGATAESSSQVTREQFRALQYLPQIARDANGRPLVSADVLVMINLPRRDGRTEANVLVRGISPAGFVLRPQVRLVDGTDSRGSNAPSRWFMPGKREVVVSRRLAARFANFNIGDVFQTGEHKLKVVGWFDGGNTAFDSEVWMDADEARALFHRQYYSSLLMRVTGPEAARALIARIESDKRWPLRAEPEVDYYSAQTRTALPIRILGHFLATAMSIGAIFAAMNTMYAAVGARTREIGTLRVLGYRRRTILLSFIIEGAILAVIGGVIGCLLALPMHGYSTATIGLETFSETVFQFRITPRLAVEGMIFAVLVGIAGSLLPAMRAARLPVLSALRSV
ncbi:MAG: FtsX-like permease family protein [Verrucomicrobiae bacterium]|nr:FtsX-like permease family protein [Verrucomicrobiae bacterium]MCX7723193.1 FtsX-like permease family protein [Verrucomicrobiae bacterium]MDW7979354.1 FtsX-like permease family protein [Verrucomicrobiales bacterium]